MNKLFSFSKHKKNIDLKAGIKFEAAEETSKMNLEALAHHFNKIKKLRFNEKDEWFVEYLDRSIEQYRAYGYEDDFVEILKKDKNMYHYWESIQGINKVMYQSIVYLFAIIEDCIEIPDLEILVGDHFISDYDLTNVLIDALLMEYHKAVSKKQDLTTTAIIKYSEIMRKESETMILKYFNIHKEDRTKCNAFYLDSYYKDCQIIFGAVSDNRTRWMTLLGNMIASYK